MDTVGLNLISTDRSGCGAVAVIIIVAILVPRETAAAVVLASWHNMCVHHDV